MVDILPFLLLIFFLKTWPLSLISLSLSLSLSVCLSLSLTSLFSLIFRFQATCKLARSKSSTACTNLSDVNSQWVKDIITLNHTCVSETLINTSSGLAGATRTHSGLSISWAVSIICPSRSSAYRCITVILIWAQLLNSTQQSCKVWFWHHMHLGMSGIVPYWAPSSDLTTSQAAYNILCNFVKIVHQRIGNLAINLN